MNLLLAGNKVTAQPESRCQTVTAGERVRGVMKVIAEAVNDERDNDGRFHATFQSALIGMAICDLDGMIADVNPEFSRMLGLPADEFIRTNIFQPAPLSNTLRGGAEIAGDWDQLTIRKLLAELVSGHRASFARDKRYGRRDGSELWGHLTVSLGRDLRSRPAFLVATLADASERKLVEEHLRESEKMEIIGRLAGGIAHDFNNLLTGILLYCDLISLTLANGGLDGPWDRSECDGHPTNQAARELSRHVEEVRMAGTEGAALTHQLLALARRETAEPIPVAINDVVSSTENFLRRLIGRQIELSTVLDPQAGNVLADPGGLHQVLLNLVLNTRDAMPHGGNIILSTRLTHFPEDSSRRPDEPDRTERSAVALAVNDNGSGMDESTRARLFEPFFTTKAPGAGTGLGMATVQRVIAESDGLISVSSELGHGTCVEIFLPALVVTQGSFALDGKFLPLQSLGTDTPKLKAGNGPGASRPKPVRATNSACACPPRINLVHNPAPENVPSYQKSRGDQHA